MNTNWSKILLFSLLSFALGYLVARTCCHGGGCGRQGGGCGDRSMCDHRGSCCTEAGGQCTREGCDHTLGGPCCHGNTHGGKRGGTCCADGGHGDHEAQVHAVIHGLKDANFQGDTTVLIEDGSVHISRHGDKMTVKVEISDSMKVEEKEVEMHAH